jgi:molybdopterin-binding protein
MSNVKIKVESPEVITAIITKESIEKLDLKKGDKVSAIIKSTEVMVGKD